MKINKRRKKSLLNRFSSEEGVKGQQHLKYDFLPRDKGYKFPSKIISYVRGGGGVSNITRYDFLTTPVRISAGRFDDVGRMRVRWRGGKTIRDENRKSRLPVGQCAVFTAVAVVVGCAWTFVVVRSSCGRIRVRLPYTVFVRHRSVVFFFFRFVKIFFFSVSKLGTTNFALSFFFFFWIRKYTKRKAETEIPGNINTAMFAPP